MGNIPGTSGPVDYPNRPEGGPVSGSEALVDALPGGTARWPEPAPTSPSGQQGAGSGTGGLYPNPGEPTSGTVQKGYKGDSYAAGGGDSFQPPSAGSNEFVTGGQNGSSTSALSVPTSFDNL